jgi:hypothetical protein
MCSNSLIVYSFLPFSMVGWFSMLVLDAFDSVHQDDRRVASRPVFGIGRQNKKGAAS